MLPVIKRQNIYEQVIDHLKNYILENELRPGDRLPTESELAQKFHVSRQSVREAVKVLESVGLVETRPRDGSRLKEINTSSLTEHLHFMFALDGATFAEMAATRSVIECAFLPTVVQNAEESDYQRMELATAEMRENLSDIAGFIQADLQFHQALIAAAKNRVMASFGIMLQEFFTMMQGTVEPSAKGQLKSIQDHEQIIAALREKDAKKASQLMHQHFRSYGLSDSVYPDA